MTVEQLKSFIQSSRKLGHTDKQVAEYLRNVKVSERLDPGVIEDLQAAGAGLRTLEALRKISADSKSMPAPPPAKPKPVVATLPPPDSLEQGRVLDQATMRFEPHNLAAGGNVPNVSYRIPAA